MIDRSIRLLLSGVMLSLLVLGSAGSAVGYVEQSRVQIRLTAPNSVRCNRTATIQARVTGRDGTPVPNQIVRWRLTGTRSRADGISSATTITNRQGRTSIKLSFGLVEGRRGVAAAASNASSSIRVRCAGGLPITSTVPPDDFVEGAPAVSLAPPTVDAPGQDVPATAIRLDRLGIDLPVVEGDGLAVPDGVASHFPDTAWPGEGSNAYFYAHAREGDFLELWRVKTGDLVEFDLADGSVADYRVTRIVPVVPYDAFEYLEPTATEQVTLQTSLWYDDTAPRFIVIAEPASGA